MVAQNTTTRVHCIVLELPAPTASRLSANRLQRELLPWADPYIASLVQRLKAEILEERARKALDLTAHEEVEDAFDDTIAALGERFEFFDPNGDEWSDWEDEA